MFILGKIKQLALLFGDFLILLASLYITLIIRYSQTEATLNWQDHFYPFLIIYFIWILVFYSQNLYNLNFTKNKLSFFKTLLEAFLINIFIAAFFFYFTPFFGIAPKTNLFLNVLVASILIFAWRAIFNIFTAKYLYKNKIAFLGYGKITKELLNAFVREPQLGYETVCIVVKEPIANLPIRQINIDELTQNFKKFKISTIALDHNNKLDIETTNKLYRLIFSNAGFVNLLKLYEEVTGKLPIETISHGWLLDNLEEAEKKVYDRVKVALDYILALGCALVLLALFPFVATIILFTSGAPIFYTQTRVGKNGKIFKIYKFRTMIKNAERDGVQRTTENDMRITRFGKFLRKTRIDELPQIINVLLGEMSFIGPRPERPEFVRELTEIAAFYPIRHLAKPGLTGWAQINYPYAATTEENLKKLQYDIYYIKNRSLLLDATIILKTFNIILRFKGK